MTSFFYLIISIPFLLGILTPSIHEGNFFSIIYAVINMLPYMILSKFIDWISGAVFKNPTLYQTNLIAIVAALIFWIMICYVLGAIIDKRRIGNKKEAGY